MNDNQDNITAETEAHDMVNHPPHYTNGPDLGKLECIDITSLMPFTLGNAFKYVWRAGKKGDKAQAIEDLKKAEFYLDVWDEQRSIHQWLYPEESRQMVRLLLRRIPYRVPGDELETTRRMILFDIMNGYAGVAQEVIYRMRSFFDDRS